MKNKLVYLVGVVAIFAVGSSIKKRDISEAVTHRLHQSKSGIIGTIVLGSAAAILFCAFITLPKKPKH